MGRMSKALAAAHTELLGTLATYPELRSITGTGTALARGLAFGARTTGELARIEADSPRRLRALVVGSNPNDGSGARKNPRPGAMARLRGEIPPLELDRSFEQAVATGYYSHLLDDHGKPLEAPWSHLTAANWRRLRSILGETLGEDAVVNASLMVNYVPWGSKNFGELLHRKAGLPAHLRGPVLESAARVHAQLVAGLEPSLVVYPWSLAAAHRRRGEPVFPELHAFGRGPVRSLVQHKGKARFRYRVDTLPWLGSRGTVVVLMGHPSTLNRVRSDLWEASVRPSLVQDISAALAKLSAN